MTGKKPDRPSGIRSGQMKNKIYDICFETVASKINVFGIPGYDISPRGMVPWLYRKPQGVRSDEKAEDSLQAEHESLLGKTTEYDGGQEK